MATINSIEVINDLELLNDSIRVLITNAVLTNIVPDWSVTDPTNPAYIANKPTKTSDFINDGSDGTSTYVQFSDIDNRNISSLISVSITSTQTIIPLNSLTGNQHCVTLQSVNINSPISDDGNLLIQLGNSQTMTQILSSDDIDVTHGSTNYSIDYTYNYNPGDYVLVTVNSTNDYIDLVVVLAYS